MTGYDLSSFKYLGGIVLDERRENSTEEKSTEEKNWSEFEQLPPPRKIDEEESPADKIIFNSLWTTQHKRSSVKLAAGKVSGLKNQFERRLSGVVSALTGGSSEKSASHRGSAIEKPASHQGSATEKPVHHVSHHELPSAHGAHAHAAHAHDSSKDHHAHHDAFGFQGLPKHAHHEEPKKMKKGAPPPQHAMTLAKGFNSGQAPHLATKGIPVDY